MLTDSDVSLGAVDGEESLKTGVDVPEFFLLVGERLDVPIATSLVAIVAYFR